MKDSTQGRPRSENANISWGWPFHTVILFMVNTISGYYVISLISSSWPKPIMANFKFPLNTQKLADHDRFE